MYKVKRVGIFVFAIGLVFTFLQNSLLAQTASAPAAGNGTEASPYEIATLENLYWIAASSARWSDHYIQTADIDASDTENWFGGQGWSPIGFDFYNSFDGCYDGEGHSITGLYINRPNTDMVGLFGYLKTSSAQIVNLRVIDVDITGGYYIGGLVGYNYHGDLSSCYVNGNINGIAWVGLLLGSARGYSIISNSYSSGYVSVSGHDSSGQAGGLAGYLSENTMMENCFSSADVVGVHSIGGLVGSMSGSSTLTNSYATGFVSGGYRVGGLVGRGHNVTITYCYTTGWVNGNTQVGGLIGEIGSTAVIISNFWNTETSGQDSSVAGVGRTTAEMTYPHTPNTYVNWDFTNIWVEDDNFLANNGYPYIQGLLGPIAANFYADIITGLEPLTVQFTDNSLPGIGEIITWDWDFGDGETSNEQHPLHIYENSGLFTVILSVTNQFDSSSSLTIEDYITVLPDHPEIALLTSASINFGSVNVAEQSAYHPIVVRNTGGATLTITEVSFIGEPFHFERVYNLTRNILIESTEQDTIFVRFAPQTVGTLVDTLFISSNAVNEPLISIRLQGTGLYVPPKPPENVQLTMDGYDAVITWDPVTENEHNEPIEPDFYIVFYNGSSLYGGNFYYHGFTYSMEYTHYLVGQFAEHMFYRVKAIKIYEPPAARSDYREYVEAYLEENLKEGMTEEEVSEVLRTTLNGGKFIMKLVVYEEI